MKKCVALFNDDWADWEAGPVLAGLREYLGREVSIATPQGEVATSIGGVRAQADLAFNAVSLTDTEILIVIGSDYWSQRWHPEVYDLLGRAEKMDIPIGAICAGTIAAARAGILDHRAHTSNSAKSLNHYAPTYKGQKFYNDTPKAVSDKLVVTAPGSAPATFAAEIFSLLDPVKGAEIAARFLEITGPEHQKTAPSVSQLIKQLGLEPHPEGGFFRETYRASHTDSKGRSASTMIYFLLPQGHVSKLHRIDADDAWHFYLGGPLEIYELNGDEKRVTTLGTNLARGEVMQHVVPAGSWFGAAPAAGSSFTLVGCTVAPGFEFTRFELGEKEKLLATFPQARELVLRLT